MNFLIANTMETVAFAEKLTLMAALVFAVWWLNRLNVNRERKIEELRKEAAAEREKLDKERSERISALENRSSECEKDRIELHKDIGDLKVEIATLKATGNVITT